MTKLLKTKNISKVIVIILAVVFTAGVLQIYSSKSNIATNLSSDSSDKSKKAITVKTNNDSTPINSTFLENSVKITKKPKEQIDVSNFKLASDIESLITSSDKSSAEKNIQNFKKLLKGLNVSDKNTEEFTRLMKKGHKVKDAMIAYEYLYENYGLLSEFEGLIKKKELGKTWAQVFKDYSTEHKEFIPTSFKPGYLEELMKDPKITIDDIMNADRISQKGLEKFENIIKAKKEGKTWDEISSKLGLVNTAEKLPRVAISEVQVDKYKKSMGLTEKQVIDALVIAGKLGEDDKTTLNKVKAGNKKDDILAQYYEKKYN